MRYVKGQSGNPAGRPKKGETMTDALRAVLRERGADGRPNRIGIAKKIIDKALSGDTWAINYVFERVEGKVPDASESHQTGEQTIHIVYDDYNDPPAPAAPEPGEGDP